MKKQSPNIVFLEYSTRGILDTLFTPKIQHLLFEMVVTGVKIAIKGNKKEFTICSVNQLEVNITIPKSGFVPILKSSLDYFIKTEDYLKCSQINELIQEIENGQRTAKQS
jgi:hypothetical protein